jgi:hypothetical protein
MHQGAKMHFPAGSFSFHYFVVLRKVVVAPGLQCTLHLKKNLKAYFKISKNYDNKSGHCQCVVTYEHATFQYKILYIMGYTKISNYGKISRF